MKCVMCDKPKLDGTIIHGINNNYRVCAKCLRKFRPNAIVADKNISTKERRRQQTKIRKRLIQQKVDKRLDFYLGGIKDGN